MNSLKGVLQKIPFSVLLVVWLGWIAYDYWTFENDAGSDLNSKRNSLTATETEIQATETKLKQATDFLRTLEAKKAELRRYSEQLSGMKSTLTENLDVPAFMKLVVTEAKKVGLTVTSIKPTQGVKKDYYFEQAFELSFQGVYVQLVVFLDRLSQTQKIVRVDNFAIRPKSSNTSRYVDLEGTVEIKAYHYIGTKEDEIGRPAGEGGA